LLRAQQEMIHKTRDALARQVQETQQRRLALSQQMTEHEAKINMQLLSRFEHKEHTQ
jgi:predicted  nucleic acid-binding Zn-ribbon protein